MSDNEVVSIAKAPASPIPATLTDATAYVATPVNALGSRTTAVAPAFAPDQLAAACTNLALLSNPGNSSGASPVLRALIQQSGCEYSLWREIFDDGDTTQHKGGNAIDVKSDNLIAIARFLHTVPSLFKQAVYFDNDYSAETVCVLNGAIVTVSTFVTSVTNGSEILNGAQDNIHISSSLSRLHGALMTSSVRAALGSPSWTLPQFATRDVYAVPVPVSATAADQERINFW